MKRQDYLKQTLKILCISSIICILLVGCGLKNEAKPTSTSSSSKTTKKVSITPISAKIKIGNTYTIKVINADNTVKASSLDNQIATVEEAKDNTFIVSGVKEGKTMIKVNIKDKTFTSSVIVVSEKKQTSSTRSNKDNTSSKNKETKKVASTPNTKNNTSTSTNTSKSNSLSNKDNSFSAAEITRSSNNIQIRTTWDVVANYLYKDGSKDKKYFRLNTELEARNKVNELKNKASINDNIESYSIHYSKTW